MAVRILRRAFTLTLVIAALTVTLSAILALIVPAFHWLPKPGESGTFLGALLGAQAAIAALTLAVTLFVMQGVSARRDVDDRVYLEYIRRSWVRAIFWGSIGAVGITGSVLMTEKFISGTGELADTIDGLRNLALIAVLAFLTNLGLAGALFERAINLTRPEQWRNLRRHVNERDVREAVQVFLRRRQRAFASLEANEPDITSVSPDLREGSADEGVRSLLDDARRAMDERRQGEFEKSLDSIRGLITSAIDEIEKNGLRWGPPGTQPEWPPLRELGRNLYPFREEVIREGSREYVFQLLRFDYWLATTGIRRRCGELFTTGLNGYRWNYQISSRSGRGEFHEMLRDHFSVEANSLALGLEPEQSFSYTREIIKNQERMLSDAMHLNRPQDYQLLHDGFHPSLRQMRRHLDADGPEDSIQALQSETLEEDYRIALMGLAGRAVALAQSDRIIDANPYLDMARRFYTHIGPLGHDIAQVFARSDRFGLSQWFEWEIQDQTPGEGYAPYPEQYPLTFFALRLMELVDDSGSVLDIRGKAKQALGWFLSNSERLDIFVRDGRDLNIEQRRELATRFLREAVAQDETREDYKLIGGNLSQSRVSALTSEVYAGAFAYNLVERLFEQEGAFIYLESDTDGAPEGRLVSVVSSKGFLMDPDEDGLNGYQPLNGEVLGRDLSRDTVHLLCEALNDATQMKARLDTREDLFQAIDDAMKDLAPKGNIAVVLSGSWNATELDLRYEELGRYEPWWQLPEEDQTNLVGRYRGYPIIQDFRGHEREERRLYIVEPKTWGCFALAQSDDGRDLHIEIEPISAWRAREMLDENPNHLPNEHDEESKLRKLQTLAVIRVVIRHGFRVRSNSRARMIIREQPSTEGADHTYEPTQT